MSTPYLLCFAVSVVAANPVFQRIPIQLTQTCPSQTCPQKALSQTCPTQTCVQQINPSQMCQTCLPQINPSQTCQTCLPQTCQSCQPALSTLPNQIRQTQCQSCQNNQRNLMPLSLVAHQSNTCPCNQPVQNQNLMNQPGNQEVLNQMVLSKLLGPQLQMLLNPNTKVCNQCATKPKTEVVPNIINNYIIIPPEYFKTNETKVIKNEEVFRRGSKGRNRNQKEQIDENVELDDNDKTLDFVISEEINNSVRSNQRSGKQGTQRKEHECACESNTGRSKLTYPYDTIISDGESNPCPCEKPEFPRTDEASLSTFLNDDKSRLLFDKIGIFLGNTVTRPNNAKNVNAISEKVTNIENKPAEETQRRNNSGKVRNFEEAVIEDFCKKNPDIPEEIAWSLLMNIKRQVQSQETSYRQPSTSYPYGYQYYPQIFSPISKVRGHKSNERRHQDKRQRRPKPRRPGRRRNKNREEFEQDNKEPCDTCEKTVELNPTVVNIETEMITTEKISTTTENKVQKTAPKKISQSQMETPNDLMDKLENMKDKFNKLNEIETTTMNYDKHDDIFPELGKEDKVPTVYDNGVDYYPDFRGDNIAFIASDEELERYHYTTDKNGVAGSKKHEQRYVGSKKNSNYQNSVINEEYKMDDSSEYSLPIPIEESNENSAESIDESPEIQFRTPPSLELPDFETKQINKCYTSEEIDDKFVTDNRASVYSGVKTTKVQENNLPVKVFSKDKKGRTSVETVFGHSKVVKYGPDIEDAGSSPVITYYLPEEAITEDRIQLPDGDRAVVVAKSIRDIKEI